MWETFTSSGCDPLRNELNVWWYKGQERKPYLNVHIHASTRISSGPLRCIFIPGVTRSYDSDTVSCAEMPPSSQGPCCCWEKWTRRSLCQRWAIDAKVYIGILETHTGISITLKNNFPKDQNSRTDPYLDLGKLTQTHIHIHKYTKYVNERLSSGSDEQMKLIVSILPNRQYATLKVIKLHSTDTHSRVFLFFLSCLHFQITFTFFVMCKCLKWKRLVVASNFRFVTCLLVRILTWKVQTTIFTFKLVEHEYVYMSRT